ncbi:MAG: hypothetical protein CTY15_08340 [Methylocystis sp.]|nr:MAG: hypothetical protein CTY15_08340 [Methylocystis sp.]
MRPALIAWAIALLLALQTLASPLVAAASAAKHHGDRSAVTLTVFGEICHSDAGGPAGKSDRVHHDCCILCEAGGRDAALVFILAFATTVLLPQRDAASASAHADTDETPPRASGWASSWSSRAPPSFS